MAAVRADEIPVPRGRPRLTGRVRGWLDRESILGPVFVTPALLLLLLLVAYPFVMAVYFSLSNAFIGRPSQFIGIKNFVRLWESDAFRQTFQNAFVFTGIAVAFKVVLGIALALLLNEQLWFKRLIRGAVLLPWVIPTALSTLGWWWMFNSLYSVVNWTGIALGLMDPPGPNWLGQRYYAMAAVITVNVWRGLPFFAITILAALVAIPKELYEAAEADGAGANARFWHITLPLLKPVLAVVVLFSTIFTFSDFNIVYILTHGGPSNSTRLFATLSRMVGIDTGASARARRSRSTSSRSWPSWSGRSSGSCASRPTDTGGEATSAPEGDDASPSRPLPPVRALPLLPHDAHLAEASLLLLDDDASLSVREDAIAIAVLTRR